MSMCICTHVSTIGSLSGSSSDISDYIAARLGESPTVSHQGSHVHSTKSHQINTVRTPQEKVHTYIHNLHTYYVYIQCTV